MAPDIYMSRGFKASSQDVESSGLQGLPTWTLHCSSFWVCCGLGLGIAFRTLKTTRLEGLQPSLVASCYIHLYEMSGFVICM